MEKYRGFPEKIIPLFENQFSTEDRYVLYKEDISKNASTQN